MYVSKTNTWTSHTVPLALEESITHWNSKLCIKGASSPLQAYILKLCESAIISKRMIFKNFSGSLKVRNWLLVNDKFLFWHFFPREKIGEQMHIVWSSRTMLQ